MAVQDLSWTEMIRLMRVLGMGFQSLTNIEIINIVVGV